VINPLKSKNKLGFVNGDIEKPPITALEAHAWERCISMVIAWFYNVINKNLHRSVAYAHTARVIARPYIIFIYLIV